ncbi:hypothetical protein MAJHIDBO_01958 [Propionibacterium freudenreichii subsp. shermanii]|nr:hypothetical protein MAJHIDBO_01958 [Propionibacterium freudenreichii subsp. shermanii]SPS09742.1 hypothetical protein MAJHIDBO_01958 [Propionibacterium freudenreichii subsp. shermanii]
MREGVGELDEGGALVGTTRAQPPGGGRAEVGQQHRARGESVAVHETRQEGQGGPRPGGHVDHRCVRATSKQLSVHTGHARHGLAIDLRLDEAVPGRDQWTRQGRGDDGVVDVGDDAEVLVVADDLHRRPDLFRARAVQAHLVPARREPGRVNGRVQVATTIRGEAVGPARDGDADDAIRHRNGEEIAPTPSVQPQRGTDGPRPMASRRPQDELAQDPDARRRAKAGERHDPWSPTGTPQRRAQVTRDEIVQSRTEKGTTLHTPNTSGRAPTGPLVAG